MTSIFKSFSIFSFIISISSISAQAAENALINNVYSRNTISLDGEWRIIMDPFETGYFSYRYQENPNGYFKNKKPRNKTEFVEYDFDTSEQLKVPGDWNSQKEKLMWYEGTVWYKRDFKYHKSDKRSFIYFGAINYDAKVYLNGEKIGEHEGGFTPFNFEITDKVKEGNNFLIVKVDNKRRRDAIPTLNSDWWNYGGITRSVSLVHVPQTFIRDYFIQLKKGSQTHVFGHVTLDGPVSGSTVTLKIPEMKYSKTLQADKNGKVQIEFDKKMVLWSPTNPKLYDVQLIAGQDTVNDKIGFRSIETRDQDILLNGKSIFLRGTCIHEEAPYRSGRAHSLEDARTLLGWAKEMGCNYVRLAHYPHNEHMIREAERMGILVWSEIPVYWTILWENPKVLEKAKAQFTEIFNRDKNRAAIGLWSLANETPLGDSRLDFLKSLAGHVRGLDNTRLITAALEIHIDESDSTTVVVNDPLGQYLDVIGCNEYFGWYKGLPDISNTLKWKIAFKKPLIMSEFGAEGAAGRHGDKLERWTEEYQEYFYTENLSMLKKIPFLRGTTPWILTDFRSPKRALPDIQDYYNRKGLISDQGHKKKAFYVMKKFYTEIEREFK